MRQGIDYKNIDWHLITYYFLLLVIGWFSIFSSVYDPELTDIPFMKTRYGMQLLWMGISLLTAFMIVFVINPDIYHYLSWPFYLFCLILLVAVIFAGHEIKGSRSWFTIGSIRFQPAEISKIATSLALASMMSVYGFKLNSFRSLSKALLTILVPMAIIVLEKETGSALIYLGFLFMMYREGLTGWVLSLGLMAVVLFLTTLMTSPWIAIMLMITIIVIIYAFREGRFLQSAVFLAVINLLLYYTIHLGDYFSFAREINTGVWFAGILIPVFIYFLIKMIRRNLSNIKFSLGIFLIGLVMIFSVDFFFNRVLQDHQRLRIENLLGMKEDLKGVGYNVHQSKIAIGSGGWTGKGFLKGTQTKFNFVPEQSTDFIFCTVGEEWGFLGSVTVIILFALMIIRIIKLCEKTKDAFTRIYGYCLAGIVFLHFFINIAMTIGLMPVIGIPLPFVSYGGSSLLAFTIFLFIFIRLDLERRR